MSRLGVLDVNDDHIGIERLDHPRNTTHFIDDDDSTVSRLAQSFLNYRGANGVRMLFQVLAPLLAGDQTIDCDIVPDRRAS